MPAHAVRQQHPILTLTLNPTLDMSTDADHVVTGDKLRCDAPTLDPGGGGTNVARAIRILGGEATALVALAGFRGQQVADLLAREQVPHVGFSLPGETRLSLAVGDRAAGTQYRFVMPGPEWTEEILTACLTEITTRIIPGMFVVLSGSMPPGVTPDIVARLLRNVNAQGGQVLIDTSGPALTTAAQGGMSSALVLRLDQVESETLAGRALTTPAEAAAFARGLVDAGAAQQLVLGRGADGSVLITKDGAWHATGPDVRVRSKVGAGDSFLGAYTLALSRDLSPVQALCHGVAAASAAVMSAATALCTHSDAQALLPQISVTRL